MATAVYVLCAVTSLTCALLLMRTYFGTRARLLLWATVCFLGLALNNVVLFIDKVIAPDTDLSTVRTLPAFLGLTAFALALVWEQGRDRS
jgi:Family of unknown function (DUF5985)